MSITNRTDSDLQTSVGGHADQLREHGKALREDLKGLGGVAKEAVRDGLHTAKETTNRLVDQGRQGVSDVEHRVAERVRDEPMKSIAIAAGVGALIGLMAAALFRRR